MGNRPMPEKAVELVEAIERAGRTAVKVAVDGRRVEVTLGDGGIARTSDEDQFDMVDMRR